VATVIARFNKKCKVVVKKYEAQGLLTTIDTTKSIDECYELLHSTLVKHKEDTELLLEEKAAIRAEAEARGARAATPAPCGARCD
jgi:hypothetical protein